MIPFPLKIPSYILVAFLWVPQKLHYCRIIFQINVINV